MKNLEKKTLLQNTRKQNTTTQTIPRRAIHSLGDCYGATRQGSVYK